MKRIPEGNVRKGILPRIDTVASLRIYHYLVPCVFFDRFRKKKSLIQREILKKVIDIGNIKCYNLNVSKYASETPLPQILFHRPRREVVIRIFLGSLANGVCDGRRFGSTLKRSE